MERRTDLGFTISAAAFELGRDHAGVVEDQHIARVQQARQVAHAAILERRVGAAHHQHPRRIARTHGAQRDPFGRKVEIEKINFHRRAPSGKPRRREEAQLLEVLSISAVIGVSSAAGAGGGGGGRLSLASEAWTI